MLETSTAKYAEKELNLLISFCRKQNDSAIIEPFVKEIIELCEAFGKSGQSGCSAPYTAKAITQAIEKLLLFQPILPLTGLDEEWNDVTNYGDKPQYQNNRNSAVFKDVKDGRAYYVDAIVVRTEKSGCWSGRFWLSREDMESGDKSLMVSSAHFIKSFPFEPKIFYIDVEEIEVAEDDWEFIIKDPKQLDEVFSYYERRK
jgi:hypothetical protein